MAARVCGTKDFELVASGGRLFLSHVETAERATVSTSHFGIAFEGEAFADGEIDIRDLAPALLALGDVIQAANRALNGGRAQASLKMRATKHGSFEALLSVDVSLLGAIGDMLDTVSANPDRLVAADQLVDLLIKGGDCCWPWSGECRSLQGVEVAARGSPGIGRGPAGWNCNDHPQSHDHRRRSPHIGLTGCCSHARRSRGLREQGAGQPTCRSRPVRREWRSDGAHRGRTP